MAAVHVSRKQGFNILSLVMIEELDPRIAMPHLCGIRSVRSAWFMRRRRR
jgi:hypothetical protein